MKEKEVTIAIPHYQTCQIIKLCLRSIRKYTPQPYTVIVIDNGSRDDSLEYLRSVRWIKLIERSEEITKMGSWAHGSALDIGLENTETEFFLSLHSDVVIKDPMWLSTLTSPFQNSPRLACVGSGKLEEISTGYKLVKKIGDVKGLIRFLRRAFFYGKPRDNEHQPEYIRTTCAMYQTEVLKQERLSFLPIEERGFTSGQALYYELVKRGYDIVYLPPDEIKKMLDHLNHGTMVLNPSLGARVRTISKGRKRIKEKLSENTIKSILTDASLDL